jgi:hypothetical protein
VCTDLSADSSSCGACFKGCQNGQVCQNGICVDPPAKPLGVSCVVGDPANTCINAPNVACCGTTSYFTCVNTTSNPFHCGGCNNACLGGQSCVNRICATSSQIVNTLLGPYSTCTSLGDALGVGPRCLDSATVPAFALTIPPALFNSFGIGVFNPASPRCMWLSACPHQVPGNPRGQQVDLLWQKPDNFTSSIALPSCITKNCPDATSGYSQIIIPNTGNSAGETVYIQSTNGSCISGISLMARISWDCLYSSGSPLPIAPSPAP